MKVSTDWIDAGRDDAPALSATVCKLTIEVGGKNICCLYDREELAQQNYTVVPAYPLAEGLATKWWWLVAGRSGKLCLRRFREGFALPNITVSIDGREITIECDRYQYDNPAVNFLESAIEMVSVGKFETMARNLITDVLERLGKKQIGKTTLEERWADIRRSQNDPEEREFCEAAGAMGVDPYMASEAETQLILQSADLFEKDQLRELLASQDPKAINVDLEWVRRQDQERKAARMRDLEVISRDIRTAVERKGYREAWRLGYATAMTTRQEFGIDIGKPPSRMADLERVFGADRSPVGDGHGRNLRAMVTVNGGLAIVVGNFKDERTQSFALARAVGDYLLFGRSGRSPVMDTYSFQQQAGRAFAAELLAPGNRIREMHEDGWTEEDIADDLFVSTRVVRHQIENKDRLKAL